ncbi:Electroneutral sodium bicarbonate exchanger 1 [Trichinella pseudospiralis]|uniref:Electroneutral sodium bicarbonate exchanger 1 n=1 Tax=Trichinella pseudospiralis TaxID=6337 RepID=A0A0V1IZD5_TRIPS|nr:Electroneutral sodium bicarbonate exchanger 1 [Trichinella pseudospiralis]KRZ27997.1 Electroneutral sodium bicarbonate exchanger 1 [Trichinella pseudospiralis]
MNRIVRKISNTLGVTNQPRKDSFLDPRSDFLVDSLTMTQKIQIGLGENGTVQRLCSIMEEDTVGSSESLPHPIFCEMLKLSDIKDENRFSAACWRELSRWIKYEEMVETGSSRWSKPHITLLTLQNLLQLKNSLRSCGEILLDVNADSFAVLADKITESWGKSASLSRAEIKQCKEILMAPKYHLIGSKFGSGKESSGSGNDSFYNLLEPLHEESLAAMAKGDKAYNTRAVHFNLLRKLQKDTEGACILIGSPDFLTYPLVQFVRLKTATVMKNLFEIPIPTRFLYILLIPKDHMARDSDTIGRCMGTLFVDEVFSHICYKAKDNLHLCYGIDEFLSQSTIVPAGRLSTQNRLEPHDNLLPQKRCFGGQPTELIRSLSQTPETEVKLHRTGKLFGGLIEDVKTKTAWYWSDFRDAFRGRITQTIAAAIFLFFANVSKIITFGGVMDHVLHKQMQGFDFLLIRLWVGLWTGLMLIIFVAIDASAFVAFITRFTEEAFATLISLIFLVKAVEELMEISYDSPVVTSMQDVYTSPCYCKFYSNDSVTLHEPYLLPPSTLTNSSREACLFDGGVIEGMQCFYKPDVRHVVADFNVTIAILLMTAAKWAVGTDVPCLEVPDKLNPTKERDWILNPLDVKPWWMALACFLPACFFSILILMDQNITSVIINRPENKLKKGYGYHLDLAVIAVLMFVCSIFGIPFYVAATVISLMHVESLRIMSETTAPGDAPQFLGLKEQRFTALVAHLLIGLSLIPMPVLLGVFLYMGIVSLSGQQFGQRILILFMPKKHQPDYTWLRQVQLKRVNLFTIIQILCFLALAVVEEIKVISMAFPLMLLFMVAIRKVLLEKIFTSRELLALDDLLPPWKELIRPKPLPKDAHFDSNTKFTEQELQLLDESANDRLREQS